MSNYICFCETWSEFNGEASPMSTQNGKRWVLDPGWRCVGRLWITTWTHAPSCLDINIENLKPTGPDPTRPELTTPLIKGNFALSTPLILVSIPCLVCTSFCEKIGFFLVPYTTFLHLHFLLPSELNKTIIPNTTISSLHLLQSELQLCQSYVC